MLLTIRCKSEICYEKRMAALQRSYNCDLENQFQDNDSQVFLIELDADEHSLNCFASDAKHGFADKVQIKRVSE